MTTLFNLFCPLIFFSVEISTVLMMLVNCMPLIIFITLTVSFMSKIFLKEISNTLFLSGYSSLHVMSAFFVLSTFNVISLVIFSYPVTTMLSFNISFAGSMWLMSIMIILLKTSSVCSFLPINSPWYLMPFLSIIEAVSLTVRPITLCFRLLANMSAGHILLSLMSKMPFFSWLLGSVFGLLELMVSMVQAFVFLMLVLVYLEESVSH